MPNPPVPTNDACVTIHPYFKVHEGKLSAFQSLCERFVSKTSAELQCLYYGFTFMNDEVFCREGYLGAAALLAHLDNVGELLAEALQVAQLTRLEIHGPADELEKLRAPLVNLNPSYFVLEYGFRR